MDLVVNVALPLSLAIIMLSLGVGLEASDFRRVLTRSYPFLIGALCQVLLLPIVALVIVTVFALPPEIAVGVMLISFCPGGATSNILTKLANGDVALSVTLTAVVSLLSILTVPVLAAWSVNHFLGEAAPDVSITGIAIAMFLITTLPIALGLTLRHYFKAAALRIEPGLSKLAIALFVVIVAAAIAVNWAVLKANAAQMGPALFVLILSLLALGAVIGRLTGLTVAETKTIALETGIQNASLGITLAAVITSTTAGLSPLALPAAIYGVLMYLVSLPIIMLIRNR